MTSSIKTSLMLPAGVLASLVRLVLVGIRISLETKSREARRFAAQLCHSKRNIAVGPAIRMVIRRAIIIAARGRWRSSAHCWRRRSHRGAIPILWLRIQQLEIIDGDFVLAA